MYTDFIHLNLERTGMSVAIYIPEVHKLAYRTEARPLRMGETVV